MPGDTIYIVVIVLGLFILVFLNDLPVRLIGACIALLSGVMLVMNLSARLKDRVEARRPAPSQSVELSVKVKKDDSGTRYVFDDFETNFGGDDGLLPEDETNRETRERPDLKRLRFDDTEVAEPVVATRREPAFKNENGAQTGSLLDDDVQADFSDEISGMRIKRRSTDSDSKESQQQPTSQKTSADLSSTKTRPGRSASANERASSETSGDRASTTTRDEIVARNEVSTDKQTATTQPAASTKSAAVEARSTAASQDQASAEAKKKKVEKIRAIPETEQADVLSPEEVQALNKAVETESASTETKRDTGSKESKMSSAALHSGAAEKLSATGVSDVAESEEVPGPLFAEAVPLPSMGRAEQEDVGSPATDAARGAEHTPYVEADIRQSARQRQLQLAMANLIDDAEHPSEEEPRKEFDYLLSRVLMVIRSMMNARTAAFFWVNLEQEELVMETRITDAADLFRSQRKYPLGRDIVSQIARSGRPEILTEIKPSAQSDLIPYYAQPAGTTSFVGVPVFLNHTVIGVLCADSTQDDAYDEITIGSLGHFTKLISGLTQSYTGKYDLLQSSRTLQALTHFRSLVNKPGASMQHIASALVESSATIVESQTIGVVLFDREKENWTIHNVSSTVAQTETLNGEVIDAESALVGRTIFRGTTTLVSPVQSGVCRYHRREASISNGFFVAVPLKSTTNCYGALFVEGHASQLTERDIAILETIGEQTGIILEQIHFQRMLKKSALLDEGTGLLNSTAFIHRLDEEVVRARDNKVPLVVVLVAIDRYSAIEHQLGQADKEEIFLHVLSLVRRVVRSYDVLGRVDDNIIAIAMSGTKDNEAQLWAERLRKEIAISVKEINRKRYTVTVSIGLAKAVTDDNAESLLTNAGRAMELAAAKTNNVMVFA